MVRKITALTRSLGFPSALTFAFLFLASALVIALSSCTKKEAPVPELRLFTWSEYFDDAFLKSFGEKNGVKVKADYFSSNEEMLAKLQIVNGDSGYDLILPSDYMVRTLIELKMVKPFDKSKLTVLADFDKDALNPEYDPGLVYTVPLAVGTTGIAVNTKLAANAPVTLSWKEMMENPAFKGKVTLLDDSKEVLQMALTILGKSMATATEADVHAAFAYLKAHKAQIKGFPPETRPVIEADECALCMAYSGDVLSVAKEKKDVRFVVPSDGATIWTDNLAIPANSKNSELAYKFINEVLSADGAKNFTLRTNYRTVNAKAREALPKEVSGNGVIYPSAAERGRMHYVVPRKDLALVIDKEWALLKSQ